MNNQDNEPNPWGLKKLIYVEYFLLLLGIALILISTSVSIIPDHTPTPFPTQIPPPTQTPPPTPEQEYAQQSTTQTVNLYQYTLPADSVVYRRNLIFITDPSPEETTTDVNHLPTKDIYNLSGNTNYPTP